MQRAGTGRTLVIGYFISHGGPLSYAPKGLPHSGQNLGGWAGSAGSKPQFEHLVAGFGLPHSEQNLPLFFAPQLQTQTVGASGLGFPQEVQNFPVFPA